LRPAVYYAEVKVNCPLEKAWKILLDYEAWNPTFIGAQVVPVQGPRRAEGELVLIEKSLSNTNGEPLPAFYAQTIKMVPRSHIVWYVYPKEGEAFRNFVDFGLTEARSGVGFNIYYYAQTVTSGDLLIQQRKDSEAMMQTVALAFKKYCETCA